MDTTIRSIVVFVPFYTPYVGGMINHSDEFTRAFARAGISVTVVAPDLPGLPQLSDEQNIRMVYYPAWELIHHFPVPKFWKREFWSALKKVNAMKYDCVVSRTRFFLSTGMAMFYAKIKRIPWIHVEHGGDHMQRMGAGIVKFCAQFYDATIGAIVIKSCDKPIAIAPGVHEFLSRYGRADAPLIYRGLDLASYEAIPPLEILREQYPGKILVLWAGRMSGWKGVDRIIDALRMLPPQAISQMQCILIGNGEERTKLEAQSVGLPVVMLGEKKRDEVIGLLKSSDIFIHSSHPGGGLSTSLLEAMACGNAIIASPHEGGRDIIAHDENGLLLTDNNPALIAVELRALLGDTERMKQLGIAARTSIADRFSWDARVIQYLEVMTAIQK